MFITALSLRNVRNYKRLDLELGPGINLFYGDNAEGKTNLLEAVCYLASLRSFRGARSSEILAWDEDSALISGQVVGGGGRTGPKTRAGHGPAGPRTKISVGISGGKRRVSVDGKRPASASGYLATLKVASFSPEDLFLVKEYPSHRRRFLDRSIFHLYPGYLDTASEYRRALGQLNAALKTGDGETVAAWEEVLAPLAAEITHKRLRQTALLAERAAAIYREVLGGGELGASYKPQVPGGTAEELAGAYLERLSARRADAMKRGHCAVGPHAEDLALTLSGRDIRTSASRGQSRLAMMALVLADCGLYNDERGGFPVLLLDDAGSELDDTRRAALMGYVSGMGQALITGTDPGLAKIPGGRLFRVAAGSVSPGRGAV